MTCAGSFLLCIPKYHRRVRRPCWCCAIIPVLPGIDDVICNTGWWGVPTLSAIGGDWPYCWPNWFPEVEPPLLLPGCINARVASSANLDCCAEEERFVVGEWEYELYDAFEGVYRPPSILCDAGFGRDDDDDDIGPKCPPGVVPLEPPGLNAGGVAEAASLMANATSITRNLVCLSSNISSYAHRKSFNNFGASESRLSSRDAAFSTSSRVINPVGNNAAGCCAPLDSAAPFWFSTVLPYALWKGRSITKSTTLWSTTRICFSISSGGCLRYGGSLCWNHGCIRISAIVMRFMGSTSNIRGIKFFANCDKCVGKLYIPLFIFLNKFGIDSSSKGNDPQSNAYKITPQDHTSTSGPAYRCPLMTSGAA